MSGQHVLFFNGEAPFGEILVLVEQVVKSMGLTPSIPVKWVNKCSVDRAHVRLSSKVVIEGNATVLRFIGRVYSIYPRDDLDASLVDSLVDMGLEKLQDKGKLPEDARKLNLHLSLRTFLVGYSFTIADLIVWNGLKTNSRWNALQKQKDEFVNLIRWYGFIEDLVGLNKNSNSSSEKVTKENQNNHNAVENGGSFDIGIRGDLSNVVTRFPPEPSGYIHIGHAKAALLNDFIAKKYKGKCILRFDDTNPSKEKVEYVDSIIEDLKILGIEFSSPISYTSDYFDIMLEYGERMIREGNAFVDDTDVQTMRDERLIGQESKNRTQTVEKNLELWKEMIAGTETGLKNCVRAKIDMKSRNGAMRDPVLFRCNLLPHHRTGTRYKVYPTYDFACPIVDSIEGVTHALRTTEYHDRNEQYYWIIDALKLRKPTIEDYSRLNFVYTLMSKRKLTWFVDSKLVSGWDDPRFPTVRGMIRRGMEIEALRQFVYLQGASKATNLMQWDKLWNLNKKILDPSAHRYTVVSEEKVPFELIDQPELEELVEVPLHPKDKSIGSKPLLRSSRIYLERIDAQDIAKDEEVTLMSWGNAIVQDIEYENDGKTVKKLVGKLNLSGSVKTTKKKLTWVCEPLKSREYHPIPVRLIELDYLITVPSIEEGMKFDDCLRPIADTWKETGALGEHALTRVVQGQSIQLNRRGFFKCDRPYISPDLPLLLIFIPDGKTKAASKLG